MAARFPDAVVEGLDSSPDMIEKARKRLPNLDFQLSDVQDWTSREPYDLIFANAVLQWIPDHAGLFSRLAGSLALGGVLAVQMPNNLSEPSHVSMAEVAADGPWAQRLAAAGDAKAPIGSFSDYRRWLDEADCDADLWQTTYVHALASHQAIVDWFMSTDLKPFIDPLPERERSRFLERYREKLVQGYPAEPDGRVLLRFPRLFVLGTRRR